MIELIPLERIDDNPYQTRTVYNAEAIEELAADIKHLELARPETLGLIQVPLGRIVYHEPDGSIKVVGESTFKLAGITTLLTESNNYRIQLAAGHSRLRAFWKLSETDVHWSQMPVDVANLTDSEMADIAWSENAKRRNISAIEEAEAIERAKTELGYTLSDLVERWGLSGSAISNKSRLLQLPLKVQEMVKAGDLRERHAREILPLVQVLGDHNGAVKMAKLTKQKSYSASEVHREVRIMIERKTGQIPNAVAEFNRWNGHQLPPECQITCNACEHRARDRCLKPDAIHAKTQKYDQARLDLTAAAVGVMPTSKNWWHHKPDSYEHAKAKQCDRLAVTISSWANHEIVPASDEFDDIYYSCVDGYDCQCAKAQREADEAEDPWAALNEWREEQNEQAKRIFFDTIDHLTGAFEAALGSVDDEGLAYFGGFLRLLARSKNYIDPDSIEYNLESLASNLAEATAWASTHVRPKTVGLALLHRAEVYQQCLLNAPVAEAEARLVILENLFENKELSPRLGPSDWMFTAEIDKIDAILQAEPGTTKLRKKLAEYKERYVKELEK